MIKEFPPINCASLILVYSFKLEITYICNCKLRSTYYSIVIYPIYWTCHSNISEKKCSQLVPINIISIIMRMQHDPVFVNSNQI